MRFQNDKKHLVPLHWVAPGSTQLINLPKSIKWVSGITGALVVKTKLYPRGGFVALRQLKPVHKKWGIKFFLMVIEA